MDGFDSPTKRITSGMLACARSTNIGSIGALVVPMHKSATAFARHVVNKHPIIQNPVTVEGWVREWSREAKNQR
jgi:hypothetical protein